MKIRALHSALVLAAALLLSACQFQQKSNVIAPGNGSSSGTGGTPVSNTDGSLLGTWSSEAFTIPTGLSCTNFQWHITSQTDTTLTGDFTIDCSGNVSVEGSGEGHLLSKTEVSVTVHGTANGDGLPPCAFELTGTGTLIDENTLEDSVLRDNVSGSGSRHGNAEETHRSGTTAASARSAATAAARSQPEPRALGPADGGPGSPGACRDRERIPQSDGTEADREREHHSHDRAAATDDLAPGSGRLSSGTSAQSVRRDLAGQAHYFYQQSLARLRRNRGPGHAEQGGPDWNAGGNAGEPDCGSRHSGLGASGDRDVFVQIHVLNRVQQVRRRPDRTLKRLAA